MHVRVSKQSEQIAEHLNPRKDSTGMNGFCPLRFGMDLQETIEVTLDYMLAK
jgi:hypothetical protein